MPSKKVLCWLRNAVLVEFRQGASCPSIQWHIIIVIVLALCATSCSGLAGKERGDLVIVGGGLRSENADIIADFTKDAGKHVLVLPTASGEPEVSGPAAVDDLTRYAPAGQSIRVLEILATTPERAGDPEYTRPIEEADALWFTGGDQSRITRVFRPDGIDSAGYRAASELLARDGCIAGSSAGAAMMCDPMIAGGSSRSALLEGLSDGGFEMGQGMGFFTHGLIDQHFLRRGRIGRLIVAMEIARQDMGWGLSEDCALTVDRAAGTGYAIGERAVLQVDAREVRRDGAHRHGLRISLMSSGDRIDFSGRTVSPAAGKSAVMPAHRSRTSADLPLEPFASETVTRLIERLALDPQMPQRAEKDGIAIVVRGDDRTRFVTFDAELNGFSALDVILDVEVDTTKAAHPSGP